MTQTEPCHCCIHCGFVLTYLAFREEIVQGKIVKGGSYSYYNRYDELGKYHEETPRFVKLREIDDEDGNQYWYCGDICKYNYSLLTLYFGKGFNFYHRPYQGFKFPIQFEVEYKEKQQELEENRINILSLLILSVENGLGIFRYICFDVLKIMVKDMKMDKCLLLKERKVKIDWCNNYICNKDIDYPFLKRLKSE